MANDNSIKALAIELPIKVRTYDIDSAGHVSNIVYLRWLEDMRLDLFEKHFSYQKLREIGSMMVIASTTIDYKRPIRLFDKPIAKMWIDSMRSTSLKFVAAIYVDGKLTTNASHIGVFVDAVSMRPHRIPSAIVEKFKMNL